MHAALIGPFPAIKTCHKNFSLASILPVYNNSNSLKSFFQTLLFQRFFLQILAPICTHVVMQHCLASALTFFLSFSYLKIISKSEFAVLQL